MTLDPYYYPTASRRTVTFGKRGMVATSQSLAAQVGANILRDGGNAIDAAIATAAALTVVEPTSNGIGGDAFALVWVDGKLHGLNASGKAPMGISVEAVKALGLDEMPAHGLVPVTVPGAPGAWAALSERFGKLPFEALIAPAIRLAEEGYAVLPTASKLWAQAHTRYGQYGRPEFAPWFDHFTPKGRAPKPGETWRSPEMAKTLRAIAETRAQAFYTGELADAMDAFSRQHGGFLRKEDLAAFAPEWVDPISVRYRGHDVWEIPPNGSGLIALQALGILEAMGDEPHDPVESLHRRIEATKLGYVDGLRYITERKHMSLTVEQMLSPAYLKKRSELIARDALDPTHGDPLLGGTVYLSTADDDGNMVSFIQSNFEGFGSGIVVPGTGISLQNRGWSFSLDEDHTNVLRPGKRTYHTIIPGFITKGDQAVGPFGVMGGYMQPQGHVQVVASMFQDGLNPQAALDMPRWKWTKGKTVEVEPGFPDHLVQALERRGHHIVKCVDGLTFGRGQIILRDPETGALQGGTEPRADGAVLPV
ncbi:MULTISPECIES: gamma-glutamyltransferase family protein [unclassified Halomonas]|uniref:gamma-glutamyltransferase family protein n=1 Tax=unclassified Halomonas TaxID=2609666 RepID=UPI00209F0C5B|nr:MULTISPECIES: gamma-glutamyltransferase family protein [unclassified Halomonas]MCP1315008.1 gamma-glutamyltransferase family protein [Halomonas sp. 707D7]MCP1326579.1 gamma-glutamyltransferase family protein [Halomonas sp. 707D4]